MKENQNKFQNLKMKLKPLIKPALLGLLSGFLLVIVISIAIIGFELLSNNQNISGNFYSIWNFALIAISIIACLIVGIGLPITWGKDKGFRRVLWIISSEVIFLAFALVISGIIINSSSNSNQVDPYMDCGNCLQTQ